MGGLGVQAKPKGALKRGLPGAGGEDDVCGWSCRGQELGTLEAVVGPLAPGAAQEQP